MKLSNQAKWYLCGPWPIYLNIHGHKDPEPHAMQELIDNGLCLLHELHGINSSYYGLTIKGQEVREKMKNAH